MLGCRSASELLRMGLRSITREQGIIVNGGRPKDEKADKKGLKLSAPAVLQHPGL